MSCNRFDKIIRFLHFNNDQNLDPTSEMAKLRPLKNRFIKKFMMAYPLDQQLDLDKPMIEYFGRHGCKQCIWNKPVRIGFNAWCLTSRLG